MAVVAAALFFTSRARSAEPSSRSSAGSCYVATAEALHGLRVGDLMARDPVTVAADLTVGRFMDDVAWSRRYTTYCS
jgi:hypothetical protein